MLTEPLRFPDGFLWGCATAAHQVEGNNTNSHWWAWEQEPGHIRNGDVSGIACDHYRRFDEDFATAQAYGHNAARISIEWSRIEPEEGRWDRSEVEHYRRVLDALRGRGLTALVTLHHFTNPLWFERLGGWLSPRAPDLLARYAGFVARELGELVPIWCTINEPSVVASAQYIAGVHPPGHQDIGEAMRASRHLLLAHARAYRAVKEAAPHDPLVGPVLNLSYVQPANPDDPADVRAARAVDGFLHEFYLRSISAGVIARPVARPDEEPAPEVEDTWDFIGLNYYSRSLIKAGEQGRPFGSVPEGAETSLMGWEVYPDGIYHCLMRLHAYGKPVYVTENGTSVHDDLDRRRYILRHLARVHRAIRDGADVRGYLHWSFCDNFEWAEGWYQKFGLWEHEPGTLNRIPRPSAEMFRDIARANAVTPEIVERYAPGLDPAT